MRQEIHTNHGRITRVFYFADNRSVKEKGQVCQKWWQLNFKGFSFGDVKALEWVAIPVSERTIPLHVATIGGDFL